MSITILKGDVVSAPALGQLDTTEQGYLVAEDGVIQGVFPALPERYAGAPVEDAVRMVSATPARIMGLKNKGRLAPAFDADITVFDGGVNMRYVYRGGSRLFDSAEAKKAE